MKPNTIEGPLMGMIDGRFVRIDIAVQDLGPQDAMLKKISQDLPTNMRNAFVLPGGKFAHIQAKSSNIICWTELDTIRIDTVYMLGKDGVRYPLFKHQPTANTPEHNASYNWAPKLASMRMFFSSTFQFNGTTYDWANSYLVCKAPRRNEIFRPPLPNIFGDSKLCMGNDYQHSSPCLADAFVHSLAHLDASRWNADAMEGLTSDHIKALLSFDADGKQIAPPKDYKWIECPACHAVNNMNYGELPLV